jgi:hypothetical protein
MKVPEFVVMLIAAIVFVIGCVSPSDPKPDTSDQLKAVRDDLDSVKQQLAEANKTLAVLESRRWILPWRGAQLKTANNLPSPSVVVLGAPDIRAAIGHSLMAASDLCGKDKVVGFFEDMGSEIRKTLVPLDSLGIADKKARELSRNKINALLSQ